LRTRISCGEYRFLKILWELEPIVSTELVSVCRQRLEWKKSTTYTVIRRLSVKKIIENNRGTVSSLVSQLEAQSMIINEFLQSYFDGSPDTFVDVVLHWSTNGMR